MQREMDLCSSFGPLGRRKIISNDSGSVVITRDGQLIARSIAIPPGDPFLEHIRKDLVAVAEKSGDGVIAASMIVFCALKSIENRLAKSYNIRARIRLLRVSEVLWSVVSEHREVIVITLVKANLWTSILNKKNRIEDLIQSAVVPSSNAAVASDVVEIITHWLALEDNRASTSDATSSRCKRILQNFDVLVHVAIGRVATSTRPVAFTAERDAILKGRCRDPSALSSSATEKTGVEFICLVQLLPSTQALRSHTVTTLTSRLGALAVQPAGLSALDQLAQFLQPSEGTTRVIFCCDSVRDEAISCLAKHRLYLIDCIPPAYLTYLAKRTSCAVYLSPEDLLLPAQTSSLSYGRFQSLERLILGTRSEIYFKLHGIEIQSAGDGDLRRRDAPRQLVLRGASSLSVGVHVSMLKRALKTIVHSLGGPTISSVASFSSHYSKDSRDINMSTLVVPGAGASELVWSVLWQQVGSRISSYSTHSAAQISSESLNSPISVSVEASQRLEEKIEPLVAFLSATIAQKLVVVHPDALCECAPLCVILSEAYLQVSLQTLANAIDVLPEMSRDSRDSRDNREDKQDRAVPSGAPHSVLQALHRWKELLSQAGTSTGRIGLIVDPDPLSDEICRFEDATQWGVVTSANHFWSGFLGMLNAVKLRLRVGEVIPVQKRQNLSPPAEEAEDSEDIDAVVQTAW